MTLVMRDSITASDIPLAGLDAVGGYGDGPRMWSSQDWARFPDGIVPLSIVINAAHQGDILDVETSDATPDQCPGWVQRFNRPNRRAPTFYCNRVTWPTIVNAVGLAVARRCDWWISTLDNTQDVYYGHRGTAPPGGLNVVAIQWKGSAETGGHYDESVILDASWIGVGRGGGSVIVDDFSDGTLVWMHHSMQDELFGAVDPSGQQAFVNAVRGGTGLNAIYDGWAKLPQAQAWAAAKRALGTEQADLAAIRDQLAHLQPLNQAALQKLSQDTQAVLADLAQLQTSEAPQA